MNAHANLGADAQKAAMLAILDKQKAAHLRDGAPTAEQRIERLDRCIGLLVDHTKDIQDAINADFGNRSREATLLTDVSGSIGPLKHAKEHLRKWMQGQKRKTTPAILGLFGAKAQVQSTLQMVALDQIIPVLPDREQATARLAG